jgi:opacity protein-like surface antigen
MKKIIIAAGIIGFLASVVNASEMYGPYGKLALGYGHADNYRLTWTTASEKSRKKARGHGFLGAAAVGYAFPATNWRTDLEYYANDGLKGHKGVFDIKNYIKIKSSIGLLSAYYDFINKGKMTPFIIAGLGWGNTKTEFSNNYGRKTVRKSNFAYQLGLGMSYEVMKNAAFEVGYRFICQGNQKLAFAQSLPGVVPGSAVEWKIKKQAGDIHAALMGFRVYF